MKTAVFDDQELSAFDEVLMAALSPSEVSLQLVWHETRVFGLRNESGQVYRVISTSDVKEALLLAKKLRRLKCRPAAPTPDEIHQGMHVVCTVPRTGPILATRSGARMETDLIGAFFGHQRRL